MLRLLIPIVVLSCGLTVAGQQETVVVAKGKIVAAIQSGRAWKEGNGYVSNRGTENFLYAAKGLGKGDFTIRVHLAIEKIEQTAASLVINDRSNFGFDSRGRKLFVQGPFFGGPTKLLDPAADHIQPGRPFDFEIIRQADSVRCLIDGKEVHRFSDQGTVLDLFGLRPWRSTMSVYEFRATGQLIEAAVQPVRSKGFTIPTIDISGDAERQIVVAEGTKTVYQGHPHTLLMPDGKTLFCVWTLNHGRGAPRMMRSDDGGRTWDALDAPRNWDRGSFPHCPTIHRVVDQAGKARLLLMDGHGPFGQSISEDDGVTWSPMATNGLKGVVAPISVLPVEGGVKHLMWTHRGAHDRDRSPLTVWQAASGDGGLTWGDFRKVVEVRGADPCEPSVIRSPDGKQLLMLMRENRRRLNSLYAISDDEGQTWSEAKELSASLTGDRHAARYAPDGRLVVAMRDQAARSPTKGHFVARVGQYEDILGGREGQYRVKLLHSHAGADCGYPGLDLLPDGTLVATTYIKYRPGPRKHSVVSVRFKLEEIDEMAKLLPEQSIVFRSGEDRYHTYRIPAIVVSTKGTALAFCEGRKEGISDHGNIHLMLKRSFDHGETWQPMQLVWKEEGPGKKVTMGNPCAVVDEETGSIWLAFCRENDRVFVTRSDDDGATWSTPRDITDDVKQKDWRWYATGPGNGIQIKRGTHKGRLVIPCDHALSWPPRRGQAYYSHVFFSDDHGETWQLGGKVGDAVNECAVAERSDGSLLLNMRTWDSHRHRAIATSADGGLTWSEASYDEALPEPQCQGSLIRIPDHASDGRSLLLFSNPADTRSRIRMTVRLSPDDGRTWAASKQLHAGPSSYSSLAVAKDGTILCLYEGGIEHRREWLRLARFRLEWLKGE